MALAVESAKFAEFKALLEGGCREDGAIFASTGTFGAYRATAVHGREPGVDEPAVWLIAQGRKLCHVGDRTYDYRARSYIHEGKNAGEAAYLVGYNSPAQFSREYKRHFGYSPSAT